MAKHDVHPVASAAALLQCCIGILMLMAHITEGYGVKTMVGRRKLFEQAIASAVLGASSPANAADGAVLSAKYCAGGVGEGCDDRAEGNEFIKALQEKSKANREANSREGLNAYYIKNYPDFFASLNPPRYLVKKPDGSFETFTDVELNSLKKEGKIGLEVPKTMGGKVVDMTQKPIMVLRE